MGCHGQMPPAPRRRGLYERISDRACLARGAGVAHLWRHQRDHEGADRPEPVTETPARTFTVTLADEGAISVPFEPRDPFGKTRPTVMVTPTGHGYRSKIATTGGVHFVPQRRANRE